MWDPIKCFDLALRTGSGLLNQFTWKNSVSEFPLTLPHSVAVSLVDCASQILNKEANCVKISVCSENSRVIAVGDVHGSTETRVYAEELDFLKEICDRYAEHGPMLYSKCINCFKMLPLASVISDSVYTTHGCLFQSARVCLCCWVLYRNLTRLRGENLVKTMMKM